jgi:sirohydrochlorin cobaltochelatase
MSNEIKTGVMICGHGSRDVNAVAEFEKLAVGLRARLPQYDVEYGFLEFALPIIQSGLEALVEKGCKRIFALPGMLFAAAHVKNDIPSVLNEFAAAHPDIEICFARELAVSLKLINAAGGRIEDALAEADKQNPIGRDETLLMVVGRGASDPDANSNVCKITRFLWEGLDLGWAETSYSGVAKPLIADGLDKAALMGFKRIVVFPYFLFTGVLVKRIYAAADAAAAKYPGIDFVKAGYLNDHPYVLDTFVERMEEIISGDPNMNCQLCKYREQVIGFEHELGKPQQGHHHHVQGIGTDHDHGPDHSHDHGPKPD